MARNRQTNLDNRILILESENRELRAKLESFESKLNAIGEKMEPIVRQWYSANQPRTPRGPTRVIYRNHHGPDTHGYYIIKILYDLHPEGLDESELKNRVRSSLIESGKNYNLSAFSRGANDGIRNNNIIKDNEGIYYYSG